MQICETCDSELVLCLWLCLSIMLFYPSIALVSSSVCKFLRWFKASIISIYLFPVPFGYSVHHTTAFSSLSVCMQIYLTRDCKRLLYPRSKCKQRRQRFRAILNPCLRGFWPSCGELEWPKEAAVMRSRDKRYRVSWWPMFGSFAGAVWWYLGMRERREDEAEEEEMFKCIWMMILVVYLFALLICSCTLIQGNIGIYKDGYTDALLCNIHTHG